LNEKQIKVLETIEESGKHLLRLINDILDLSKINAGKFEISLEPFSLEEICQSSLNLTKGMSDKKKQRVSFSFPTKPIMIHADARRLKQAFVNLLSNAIKFTAVGGELGLDVQLNEIERQVIITVWDKGIGIKPEEMPKLFKAFTQIDAKLSRQYEGTGLGLSLVKEIVELHHGNIHVISTNNEGSKFYITLPVIDTNINASENG
jgi:signal transduction histidine kinase